VTESPDDRSEHHCNSCLLLNITGAMLRAIYDYAQFAKCAARFGCG